MKARRWQNLMRTTSELSHRLTASAPISSSGQHKKGRRRQGGDVQSFVLLHTRRIAVAGIISGFSAIVSNCQAAVPRRASNTGDWSSPGLATPLVDSAPKFLKTTGGVRIQELAEGSGPAAHDGERVEINYVLRRSNGYFIYSTVEGVSFQPKDIPTEPWEFVLGEDGVIAGLQDAVRGMRPGGKRRALIPPGLGYAAGKDLSPQPPAFAAKRQLLNHVKEPLLFEIQLVRIRGRV